MSETILLVGHGSRAADGNREIEQFVQLWRERQPAWRIEVCFIEFAEPQLDAGLTLAAQDARRVIVVPLILNAAGHAKMEIPAHIAAARLRHPATEFVYARHLGAVEPVLHILERALRSAMLALDAPDPKTTGVILLGRGSSDRVANGEVAKMARWLHEESGHELVDIAFTGITHPRLETVVQRHSRIGMTQVVVLPYYLFTGTLIERIQRQIVHLRQQYPLLRFGLGGYFGFEQEIFGLLDERVRAARADGTARAEHMMECDGCKYRDLAEAHESHHHDHGHTHAHAVPA
ncbi:MAG: sirohydrochlorin chelatase [Thiobacillus sp.]